MKRLLSKLTAVSALCLGLFLALTLSTANAADDLELIEPGVLSTATEGAFAPFSMRTADGKLEGFELAVIGEVAKRLGLEHKPVVIKWDSILVGLMSDQYDMISNPMGITEERQKSVTFCDAWVESGAKLIVPDDSAIKSLADAKGKKIGVIVASTFVPMAENLGGEVKLYKSDAEAMQDVANGRIDAAITDAVSGGYAIKIAGLELRLVDEFIESYQMGWPVKQGKPNLVKAINKTLAEMIEDGTYAALGQDILGMDPTPAEPIRSILD